MLGGHIDSPRWSQPLAIDQRVVVNGEVEDGSCWSDQLVTLAADLNARGNVVLLLVALGESSELRARQNASWVGMCPGNTALQNERMFEVVRASYLTAIG